MDDIKIILFNFFNFLNFAGEIGKGDEMKKCRKPKQSFLSEALKILIFKFKKSNTEENIKTENYDKNIKQNILFGNVTMKNTVF